MIIMVLIIIMAAFIGISGGSEAKVELNGDQDEALIQQSSGVHLFEVNCADLGANGCNGNWSWIEYLCVLLVFIFILKCTHIAHYCFLTKKLVKKKKTRDMSLQMENLNKEPLAKNPVIVLGIVYICLNLYAWYVITILKWTMLVYIPLYY